MVTMSPDDIIVDSKVGMREAIARSYDLSSLNVRMLRSDVIRNVTCCFTD